eukprot:GFYU01002173.1.p1 GENE.GFYU01002173.1~~GFYU01002173.1.p1  ORF type:complete len:409 (-),score=99.06 GFYU01002173.1:140-1366(-)
MDRYQLVEKLGEGAYGAVYLAIELSTDQVFAVKTIRVELELDSDFNKVQKEIEIHKSCDSDFIVQYKESFMEDGYIWIVMEHCEGGSVRDLLHVLGKPMPEKAIAAACKCVLQGLAYLHSRRSIHRDVKAGNVLMSLKGECKLADFGVSKECTDSNKGVTVIGTPFWMAPEVIQALNYDGKADIWSLGITAIEMAELQPPHSEKHPMRAIFMIPMHEPPKLKDKTRWSAEFHDFLRLCLQKKAAERPNAADLLKHPFIASISDTKSILKEIVAKNIDGMTQLRRERVKEEEATVTMATLTLKPNMYNTSDATMTEADNGTMRFVDSDTMRHVDEYDTMVHVEDSTMREARKHDGDPGGFRAHLKKLKLEDLKAHRQNLEMELQSRVEALHKEYAQKIADVDAEIQASS